MDNLSEKSRKSFGWDFLGTFSRQMSTLIVSIVLARILSPDEFGVIGMALVFTSISEIFIDAGFTDGIIQQKKVSRVAYSSIFFLNLGVSLLLALIIFFSAGFVGRFYNSGTITEVIQMLAFTLPLSAVSKVHLAQLMKKLDFKSIAIRDSLSTIIGGGIGILLAIQGYGVFSLVWQQLSAAVIGSILLWYATKWKPSFIFSWKEVKGLLSFSLFVFFDQFTKKVFQKVDTLFIGKVFSPTILGFYTRAESLNAQITNYTGSGLNKVMFPVLSAMQDDDSRFQKTYYSVYGIIAVVSGSLTGFFYFIAEKLIIGLLGTKWEPSIVIFQILVFRTLISPYGALMTKTLLSKGHSKLKFQIGLLQRFIMLIPLPFGLYFGINTFALIVVLAATLYFFIYLIILSWKLDFDLQKQLKVFLIPLLPFFCLMLFSEITSYDNTYALTLIYVLFQFVFLALLRVESFLTILKEFSRVVNSLRKEKK